MNLDKFEEIRERYGFVSSWACWSSREGEKATSGVSDLEVFNPNNPNNKLEELHTRFVLVGLNISRGDIDDSPWRNFHSASPNATDYKLRYALEGSALWGSYMTDLLKDFVEVSASKASRYFKQNPRQLEKHLTNFEEELGFVCEKRPVLFALGDDTYNLLNEHFSVRYEIVKLYHYARRVSLEELRTQYMSSIK